ncbi:acyltransferase family protein [Methylobacterium sp. C33D]
MAARVYHPKFDGLRALAIIAVMYEHLVKTDTVGGLGTGLFFCLSGFLITDIILDSRERMTLKPAAVQFYWHRFLRLAPPFYLAIAVCLALGVGGSHRTLLANAFYVANINMFATSDFNESGHFWTLSVEEQFYLLWFPVAMLAPVRRIPAILIALIIASLLSRLHFCLYRVPNEWMLPINSADLLCSGALLATALRSGGPLQRRLAAALDFRFALPASLVVAAHYAHLMDWAGISGKMVAFSATCLCMASLIRHSLSGVACRPLDWLAMPSLRHAGKISYGLYVYHYFVPQICEKFIPEVHTYLSRGFYLIWITALSFIAAELSWRFLEQPVLRLKRIQLSRATSLQAG